MRMAGLLTTLQLFLACAAGAQAALSEAGHYFVTAPNSALAGSPYQITIQVVGAPAPVNFSAFLEVDNGIVNRERAFVAITPVASVSVVPGTVETLKIDVPDQVKKGSYYRLHVRGTGGLQVEETHTVSVDPNIATAFIQTDKDSYYPGDTVTFKTFALRKKDLAAYPRDYTVSLRAGNVQMIRWASVAGDRVNTFSYLLDSHTVQGQWQIVVSSVSEETYVEGATKVFTVKPRQVEETSPTSDSQVFDVKVHLPKTKNSSTPLIGWFEANYPMGVSVKGTAEVTLNNGVKQTLQFNGNANFTFPYNSVWYERTMVTVTVVEDGTGIKATGDAYVDVYTRDVKIEFTEQTPAVFKPKLPFTAYIKISNQADEPLHIPADSVYSTVHVYGVGYYSRPAPPDSNFGTISFTGSYPILAKKLTLPDSGLFSLDLEIPDDVTSIDLVVTFQGVQRKQRLERVQHSSSDNYLQIYLVGDVPEVTDVQNGEAKFRIVSSQPLTEITVELVSRGNIVSAVNPQLMNKATSGNAYSAEFSVTLTWQMTPVTDVIAYHIVDSDNSIKEIVTDSMVLNVQGLFTNKVEVTSEQQRVEPGQEVTVRVQARPDSVVGILVEEDNGVSELVFTLESVSDKIDKSRLSPLDSNPALATTQQFNANSFSGANLILLNGELFAGTGSQTSPLRQNNGQEPPSTELPNTIFLGTNSTQSDGTATFSVTLPDTVNTWVITGFAFDNSGHVGVVSQPYKLQAAYEVFGELLGPDHVVSGEHVVLSALVHNTRNIDSEITLTLHLKENVEILNILPNGTVYTTTNQQQKVVTVPAKKSEKVFFTVISPSTSYARNARVKLDIKSGNSKQTVSYVYTVVPIGVEQIHTFSELVNVNGQVAHDLSTTVPKEALPKSTSRRVLVTDDFADLLLPLVLAEVDVLEEGTGPAALLHLALPVMLAKAHPKLLDSLKEPIELGYQRLLSFLQGDRYTAYRSQDFPAWLTLGAMQVLAEAKDLVYVDDSLITNILFSYYIYQQNSSSLLRITDSLAPLTDRNQLEAFAALAVQNISHHVNVYGHQYLGVEQYPVIIENARRVLQSNFSMVTDPLTLSYLTLANLRYGFSATSSTFMSRLLSLQDPSGAKDDILFWNTNTNDSFNYYGDWLPGLHVAESRDIVTAANALLVLVQTGRDADADRVARWLMRQRQGNGAFKTAWDTLAATEALLAYSHSASGSVRLDTAIDNTQSSQWMTEGQLTNFTASGQGKVYSQVEVRYHVTDDVGDASFEVVPVVLDESLNHFRLMICSRWLLPNKESGVTVQEVNVPSGFTADTTELRGQRDVMQFIRRNVTTISIFFRQVARDSTCYTLPVNRIYPVARTAPAYIITRSIDTPENQDIVSYRPPRLTDSTVCDLCSTCCPSS